MELVRAAAEEAGDRELEGRALTALADVALLRDADLPRGRELVEQALELLDGTGGVARFEALTMRSRIDWWLGDLDSDERYTRLALAVAQEAGSTAHEAEANEELASIALSRLDLDGAAEFAERALELAEESGNRMTRAWALVSLGRVERARDRLPEAERLFAEARELFEETGSAWALGRTLEGSAWVVVARRRPRTRRAAPPRRDPDPDADRGPRRALRGAARAAQSCSSSAASSTRRSAGRSRRARPSARTTRSRARRRGSRSGSSGLHRAGTTRPSRCSVEALEVARGGGNIGVRIRRLDEDGRTTCASAAATRRPTATRPRPTRSVPPAREPASIAPIA